MGRTQSTSNTSTFARLRAKIVRILRVYPYVLTCASVTVGFLVIAYATSLHIGVPIRDPEGTLLGKRMVSPIILMIVFAWLDSCRRAWAMRRAGSREPFLRLAVATFRDRWWWKRLILAVIGFLCFAFTYLAYRNLKSFVSLINYRSYDPELLNMDRWLVFGNEPANVFHDLLGVELMAYVLSWIYLAFIPLVPITVSAALAFVQRMREAYVYVAAMMWCWILGTASYYMIPTLGPFASRPRNFADLPSTNVTRIQNVLIDHRFELHADNIGEVVVGGIAGFASLHVGIVVSCWLMMRYYEQRVLEYIALGFLVPTIIATIYFGWHFIIDDVAGFLIGWLSVVLARATVYPHLMVVWRRRAGDAVHSHHTTKAE